MPNPIEIRSLEPGDLDAWQRLRREALDAAPHAFAASPEDDRVLAPDFGRHAFEDASRRNFGAFAPGGDRASGELCGIAGVGLDDHRKAAHKAWIWGVYVPEARRGQGIGRRLVEVAIAHATAPAPRGLGARQVALSASERSEAALALYASLGFETWGIEPGALCIAGEYLAEHHMLLLPD